MIASTKTTSSNIRFTTKPIFGIDCGCESTCSFAVLGCRFEYFQLRHDDLGRIVFLPLTKCTAIMRILAYSISTYFINEYLKITEITTVKCMKNSAVGVIQVFREEYLRKPTQANVGSIASGRSLWFSWYVRKHWLYTLGMKELSIRKWVFVKVIYRVPTLMLETIASYDLYIWLAFFGCPKSLNNLNLLHNSSVFLRAISGSDSKMWICRQWFQVQDWIFLIRWYLSKLGDHYQKLSASSRT